MKDKELCVLILIVIKYIIDKFDKIVIKIVLMIIALMKDGMNMEMKLNVLYVKKNLEKFYAHHVAN